MKTVPTPPEAAALRELGMLRSDELPMIAANWLVEQDTPALRRLAGLDGSDGGWLIDTVWADVTAELNVESVSVEAAWQLAMSHEVAAWRAGEKSTVDVLREVVRFYIDNGYPKCGTGGRPPVRPRGRTRRKLGPKARRGAGRGR